MIAPLRRSSDETAQVKKLMQDRRIPRARGVSSARTLEDYMQGLSLTASSNNKRASGNARVQAPFDGHDGPRSSQNDPDADSYDDQKYNRGVRDPTRKLFNPKADRSPRKRRDGAKADGTAQSARDQQCSAGNARAEVSTLAKSGDDVGRLTHVATPTHFQLWKDSVIVTQASSRTTKSVIMHDPVQHTGNRRQTTNSIEEAISRLEASLAVSDNLLISSPIQPAKSDSFAESMRNHVALLELYIDLFKYGPTGDYSASDPSLGSTNVDSRLTRYWTTAIEATFHMLNHNDVIKALEAEARQEWIDYFFVQCYGLTTVLLLIETVHDGSVVILRRLANLRLKYVSEDAKAVDVWQSVKDFWSSQLNSDSSLQLNSST